MRLPTGRPRGPLGPAAAIGLILALSGCGSSSDRDRDRDRDRRSERSDREDRENDSERGSRSDREDEGGAGNGAFASAAGTGADSSQGSPAREARTWRGTYTCGQGQTGLEITLRPVGRGTVAGTFSFYPVPSNPSVPRGCFRVTGRMDQTGRFETSAGQWVRQPPGYQSVNLSGQIGANGGWSGRVVGAGGACTSFSLQPASAPQESCQ